jgi:FHS family L-fucose permease-like MFS transporter
VGIGAYFINLAVDTWQGLTSQQGAFLLSIAAAGYLIGRFATTALLLRFPPRGILTLYGLVNVALCLVVAAGIQQVSALALVAVFFFMSTMFATIFALGVSGLGGATRRASSLMVMAIGGGVLLPYPMGRIAEAYGTPAAFLLPAACFAVVALYGWKGAARA